MHAYDVWTRASWRHVTHVCSGPLVSHWRIRAERNFEGIYCAGARGLLVNTGMNNICGCGVQNDERIPSTILISFSFFNNDDLSLKLSNN